MKITNKHNLSFPMAVLVSTSDYDHDNSEKTISVTGLLKPVRAIVLGFQNKDLFKEIDLVDLIPSSFGSAIHAFAEKGWRNRDTVAQALRIMSVSEKTIDQVVVNPKDSWAGQIAIYTEKRSSRKINGWTVRGKFDGCVDGKLFDYKTTSVWSYIFGSNRQDYILQGSMYRWLNPTIVTDDNVSIESMFTDWSAVKARSDKKYPQLRALSQDYPLMSLPAIEEWIVQRISEIDRHLGSSQKELPRCNDEELWASEDKWKYYKGDSRVRATKVFNTLDEAQARFSSSGTGAIVHFPGEVKRCQYCNVVNICDQAAELRAQGRLTY